MMGYIGGNPCAPGFSVSVVCGHRCLSPNELVPDNCVFGEGADLSLSFFSSETLALSSAEVSPRVTIAVVGPALAVR